MVSLHSATGLLPKSCFQRWFLIQEIMVSLHSATRLLSKDSSSFRRSWLHCTVLLGYYPKVVSKDSSSFRRSWYYCTVLLGYYSKIVSKDMLLFLIQEVMVTLHSACRKAGVLCCRLALLRSPGLKGHWKPVISQTLWAVCCAFAFDPTFHLSLFKCHLPLWLPGYRHRCVSCSVLRTLNQTDFQCL